MLKFVKSSTSPEEKLSFDEWAFSKRDILHPQTFPNSSNGASEDVIIQAQLSRQQMSVTSL